jgi:hypothetical protein
MNSEGNHGTRPQKRAANQRTATVHCDGRACRVSFGLLQHILDVTPPNNAAVNNGLKRTIALD